MIRKQLIIIPGLGDRLWLYRCAAPLWRLLGFDVHFFVFGWNSRGSYAAKVRRLRVYIEKTTSPVYVIGASAGGTAAVNALATMPEKVTKVVTIATPYTDMPGLRNSLLRESIAEMVMNLQNMDTAARHRIISMHGKEDAIVPVQKSQAPGVASKQLNAVGHGLTIFLALTVYSSIVRKALLK